MEFTKVWDTFISCLSYTQTELKILGICSALCGAFSFLIGGLDLPIYGLLTLIIIDFATGLWAGWVNAVVSSRRGYNGLGRKGFMLFIVCIANLLDYGIGAHMFRTMMVGAYSILETISIVENLDRAGYSDQIPQFLRDKLIQIRDEKGIR